MNAYDFNDDYNTTDNEVHDWFSGSAPGDTLVYRKGPFLRLWASDKHISSGVWAIRRLYDDGQIELFQRRVGPKGFKTSDSIFEYVAVKNRTRKERFFEHTFEAYGLAKRSLVAA